MPYLAAIFIYPIKSLDRVDLTRATMLESGALEGDREFALFDERGRYVNGKREPKIYRLRSLFDDRLETVSLRVQGTEETASFHLERERSLLENWLSDYFGYPVKLARDTEMGFPDDTDASGPTAIATGTLEEVASWFPVSSVEEARRRFRANLEIGGAPPFWEDRLFSGVGRRVRFRVGEAILDGINPCQRCVVPARDSRTGEATPDFQKVFATRRKESLPPWTTPSRFDHFYKLSVNTIAPPSQAGKLLQVGDEVEILGERGEP